MLRYDDIAALNRIYPITAANLASFPGKQLTAANTVSIQGTIDFRRRHGHAGRERGGAPARCQRQPALPVHGHFRLGRVLQRQSRQPGHRLGRRQTATRSSMWGSNDPALQGYFDLSFMPLPPGMTTASYQVTFEPINPLYMLTESVGPYMDGSPSPSGTMPVLTVPAMAAGSVADTQRQHPPTRPPAAIRTPSPPKPRRARSPAAASGCGRLSQVGQTDWFVFPVRGGRTFTVVTQALDETGAPTETKALLALGVWDAFDPVGSPSVGWAPGLNGWATGETWLRVSTSSDDVVRLGIADMRGDGRPDYAYMGWVLYADTVCARAPSRLRRTHRDPGHGISPLRHGPGRRPARPSSPASRPMRSPPSRPPPPPALPARWMSKWTTCPSFTQPPSSPAESAMTQAPATRSPWTPRLPTPCPSESLFPSPSRPSALPWPPPAGVTVTYTVASGTATLGCGLVHLRGHHNRRRPRHHVRHRRQHQPRRRRRFADQRSQRRRHTSPAEPPLVSTALTPTLSVAAGSTFTWTTQALVLNNGAPMGGQSVAWQPAAGITVPGAATAISNASGIAAKTLTVGPLPEGQQSISTACVNGTSNCANFTVLGARPEYAWLQAVSGTAQSMAVSGTPEPDRSPPPRHERQSHGRRHRHVLPVALRVGSALPSPRPLRVVRASRNPILFRSVGSRRHGRLQPRLIARHSPPTSSA